MHRFWPDTSRVSTHTSSALAVGPRAAYFFAAASTIIYSSPPVVTCAVSVGVPPLALSLSRWLIALVILLPWASRRLGREWPKLKVHWPALVFKASFRIVGSTLSVVAVYFTTATNAVPVVNAENRIARAVADPSTAV